MAKRKENRNVCVQHVQSSNCTFSKTKGKSSLKRENFPNKQLPHDLLESRRPHTLTLRMIWYARRWKSAEFIFFYFQSYSGWRLLLLRSFCVDDAGEHTVSSSHVKGKNNKKIFCNKSVHPIQPSAIDVQKEISSFYFDCLLGKSKVCERKIKARNFAGKHLTVRLTVDLGLFGIYSPMHINAIHPSSPNSSQSEDDAATRIQAQWKGYRVRKQLRNSRRKSATQNGHGEKASIEEKSATKIQASWKGFKIRKELQTCRIAATKIQAGWKGFKARKELKGQVGKDGKAQ